MPRYFSSLPSRAESGFIYSPVSVLSCVCVCAVGECAGALACTACACSRRGWRRLAAYTTSCCVTCSFDWCCSRLRARHGRRLTRRTPPPPTSPSAAPLRLQCTPLLHLYVHSTSLLCPLQTAPLPVFVTVLVFADQFFEKNIFFFNNRVACTATEYNCVKFNKKMPNL